MYDFEKPKGCFVPISGCDRDKQQGISSSDVVLRLGRKVAPPRAHALNSSNSRRCDSPLGHLPSSCRLTLAHLDRPWVCSVLWRCGAFVCISRFQNRITISLKKANEKPGIEHCCLLLRLDSVLPYKLFENVTSAS